MSVVYSVYSHTDSRETFHEKTFSTRKKAVDHAQALADDLFGECNHDNDSKLLLFGPEPIDDACDHWSYGYVPEHAEPLVSVEEHQVH